MNCPAPSRLALSAHECAEIVGCSERHWWALHSEEKTPASFRLGRRGVRWHRAEVEKWLAAGCPDRTQFEAMRGAAQ